MPVSERKYSAVETLEGAGARVRRLFPTRYIDNRDPFVLLDEFFVDPSTGFPEHLHRGFEAVTYMIEGSFRHKDNLGNDTEVSRGGVQRFTAGQGLRHSEMPGKSDMNHGFQLWINLPRRLKGVEPSYQQVEPTEIPESEANGVRVRTIVGEGSPVRLQTPVRYLDISLEKGITFLAKMTEGSIGFVYAFEGVLKTGETTISAGEAFLLNEGEELPVEGKVFSRFLVVAGKPHGEPIYQHGPFVD